MPFEELVPNLFLWTDTCNVYVLKEGSTALLIDLGDGSVLDHLGEIGVTDVEWILFTHHHREQCQGLEKLGDRQVSLAAPDAERALFETPFAFRKWRPTLGDALSVYGASYVRPPRTPVKLTRTFQKMDDFTWRGHEFWCVDTRGDSPGGMSYFWQHPRGQLAFTGDLMCDGAKLHTWFDVEWDYGFAKGLYAHFNSAALVDDYNPTLMFPAHGPVIRNPRPQLKVYQDKLRELAKHYVRGYELFTFAGAAQDRVSKPTKVPHVWQITPHLFKFKGPDFWPNFSLLLAENGHALVIDCGLFQHEFLEKSLKLMQERLGLKQIDAVLVTHMHGDHFQEAPLLREKWGAELWTMDRVVDLCEHPARYDYSASINTYQKPFDHVKYDRVLRDGETIYWEGYTLTIDWMPGQTEFASCIHGEIDGQRIAFTGDNIFASPTDPQQSGHEAVVARNGCRLEEGYLYAASYLHTLQPDILVGGHSWVMGQPAALIRRFREGALALRAAYQSLSRDDDYRYMYDPYWVHGSPYRVQITPGETASCAIEVRNYRDRPQQHRIVLRTPPGITAEPAILEGQLGPDARIKFPVKLTATAEAEQGLRVITFDITLDGQRLGEWFDMQLLIGPETTADGKPIPKSDKDKAAY